MTVLPQTHSSIRFPPISRALRRYETLTASTHRQSGGVFALPIRPDLDVDDVNAVAVVVPPWVDQEINDVPSADVEAPLDLLPVGGALGVGLVASFE